MRRISTSGLLTVATLLITPPAAAELCEGFGPQAPRSLLQGTGDNPQRFPAAPEPEAMELCNIHFHHGAEHKAEAYSVALSHDVDKGTPGYGCDIADSLSEAQLRAPEGPVCGGLKPGDTVEVHWVFTSCDVTPGEGLGSCLTDQCANPTLRVEAQVFTLANDASALDIRDFDWAQNENAARPQPASLPEGDAIARYRGSTTGPAYSQSKCSPLQVDWSVRRDCKLLDINSLAAWCEDNAFNESAAHGVRPLVTAPELLSPIDD